MKFPKLHYERILQIIKSEGLDLDEFYFVKRKGWIRIEHLQSKQFFTFFKKKETRINQDTREWENSVYFKVKMNGDMNKEEPSFDAMIQLFGKWVKDLRRI